MLTPEDSPLRLSCRDKVKRKGWHICGCQYSSGASISVASPISVSAFSVSSFGARVALASALPWCQHCSGVGHSLVSAFLRSSVIPMLLHILRTALKRRAVYSKALRISRCFSSLCLFGEVIMLLCSQAPTHSSCLLCGHHAVEAAQGKVSQILFQAVATRE
jgi:hypothetical protein